MSFESRYYVNHNIERASTNTWRHILSTLKNNRFECPCYGLLIAAEDLDHDEDLHPFKRQKTFCTDKELLEIYNVTAGIDRTSLQPVVKGNDCI